MATVTKTQIKGTTYDIVGKVAYATSSTTAATAAKTASTSDSYYILESGTTVKVLFANANTASSPTLSVDGSTAKSIKAYGTITPTVWWKAGDVVEFTYDGTNWIMGATQSEIEQIKSDLTANYTTGTAVAVVAGDYTAPSNGYLAAANIDASQQSAYLQVWTGNTSGDTMLGCISQKLGEAVTGGAIFVHKGQHVYIANRNCDIRFLPLNKY